MACTKHTILTIMRAIVFTLFLIAFVVGMIVLNNSANARHGYEHYRRTTCLITNHTFINYEETICGSMTGRNVACIIKNHTGEKFAVSFLIGNGTVVDSEMRFDHILEPEYYKQVFTFNFV